MNDDDKMDDYIPEFTKIQKTKINYLVNKGGKFNGVVSVFISMPDESIVIVDPFGRAIHHNTKIENCQI